MSQEEQHKREGNPPYIGDESLVVNTRLKEIERQQREDKETERKHNRSQLRTNRLLAVFTGLLFVTSVISNVLLFRQTAIVKESADAAKSAADAAKSAADTAKIALHVSERAYLAPTAPSADVATGTVTMRLDNVGRIPSGHVTITIHEATVDPKLNGGIGVRNVIEKHWKHVLLPSILSSRGISFLIPIPQLNMGKPTSGMEIVIVGGHVVYNDGFPDSPDEDLPFCSQTKFNTASKQIYWAPCIDEVRGIRLLELWDGYPKNEQKD